MAQVLAVLSQLAPAVWAIINGLALIGLGAAGAWIAFRQMITARTKLQLDLYDKRYPIFAAARDLVGHITQHGAMTNDAFSDYLRAIAPARFLYDREMLEYLRSIKDRGIEIQAIEETLPAYPVGMERANLVRQKADRLNWVVAQFDIMEEKFAPYLQLEQRVARLPNGNDASH